MHARSRQATGLGRHFGEAEPLRKQRYVAVGTGACFPWDTRDGNAVSYGGSSQRDLERLFSEVLADEAHLHFERFSRLTLHVIVTTHVHKA